MTMEKTRHYLRGSVLSYCRTSRAFGLCHVFIFALLGVFGISPAFSQSCPEQAVERNRNAVVFIRVLKTLKQTGQGEERTGTGFIVDPAGYVLTNRHVIESNEKVDEIKIEGSIGTTEGPFIKLQLIAKNESDVALLKFADTSRTYKYALIGVPALVKLGAPLCSVSFPKKIETMVTSGTLGGKNADHGFWHTEMPSNPGDSGAPVFIASGHVVAIKVGGYDDAQNINLLIPINLAYNLLELLPGADLIKTDASSSASSDPEPKTHPKGSDCEAFLDNQGDEASLALLGEKAFAQKDFECVITFFEQAKRVQSSKVWERDYPYLAAAYLLARGNRQLFEETLKEMISEMRRNNSYLHHGGPIGQALQNLTYVRQYLDREAKKYIDQDVFPEVIDIKASVEH
jgi:tetratricopeptide (TPR) repeat protein